MQKRKKVDTMYNNLSTASRERVALLFIEFSVLNISATPHLKFTDQ